MVRQQKEEKGEEYCASFHVRVNRSTRTVFLALTSLGFNPSPREPRTAGITASGLSSEDLPDVSPQLEEDEKKKERNSVLTVTIGVVTRLRYNFQSKDGVLSTSAV